VEKVAGRVGEHAHEERGEEADAVAREEAHAVEGPAHLGRVDVGNQGV